jgi:hypothetical protein
MKRNWLLILLPILLISAGTEPNNNYREWPCDAFGPGEKIKYRVHYGFITAGEAELAVDKKIHTLNGRPCYKIDVTGRTTGLADKLYDVKDVWGTYLDTGAVVPHRFYRYIKENSYRKNEVVDFQQLNNRAVVNEMADNNKRKVEKTQAFEVPQHVQDLVSGYYYFRTIDFNKYKKGDVIKLDAFFDDEIYNFNIRYDGKERIKTELGKVDAIVLTPHMPDNELFDGKESIQIWLSDDEVKIPLKIKAKMFIGAIEVDIEEFSKGRM